MPRDERSSLTDEEIAIFNADPDTLGKITGEEQSTVRTIMPTTPAGFSYKSTPQEMDKNFIYNNELAKLTESASKAVTPEEKSRVAADIAAVQREAKSAGVTLTASFVPPIPSSVSPSAAYLKTPLTNAQAAFNANMAFLPKVFEALTGANANAQAQSQIKQAAIQQGAKAAGETAVAQAEITIAQNVALEGIEKALGLDIRDPESHISQLLQEEARTKNERQALRSKITELQSKSLFSDPIGYLMAIPELQSLVPIHNELVDRQIDASSEITRLQAIQNNARVNVNARSADLIRAKAAKDATVLAESAKVAAADANAAASAVNARTMWDMFTLGQNVFQSTLSLEAREQALQLKKDSAEAKKAIDDQDTAMMVGINTVLTTLNGPAAKPVDKDFVKKMPAKMKEMWQTVLLRGSFGNNYAEAIPFMDEFGNAATGDSSLAATARTIRLQAEKRSLAIISEQKLKGVNVKHDDALAAAYGELYTTDRNYAVKGFDKAGLSTSTSPYAIDYDSALAAAVANKAPPNIVIATLAKEKERNPYKELTGKISDRLIIDSVAAEVVAGKILPEVAAAQVVEFYKNMSKNQYEQFGLKNFGLPRFTDYSISLGNKGTVTTDLFNPSRVENYFTTAVAAQRRKNLQPVYTGRGTSMFNPTGENK